LTHKKKAAFKLKKVALFLPPFFVSISKLSLFGRKCNSRIPGEALGEPPQENIDIFLHHKLVPLTLKFTLRENLKKDVVCPGKISKRGEIIIF
jgi:hypothetical protein